MSLSDIERRKSEMEQFLSTNLDVLRKELSTELPAGTDPQSISRLKSMATYAEAKAMDIGYYLRAVSTFISEAEQAYAGEYYKQARDNGQKTSVTASERYVKARLGPAKAYEKQLEQVQEIIKRRVLLAQTMLKSAGTEGSTTLSNNNREY